MRFPFFRARARAKASGRGGMRAFHQTRGFAAAQTDRLLAGWRYDGGFTAGDVSAYLATIRARSRQMAKDSPHYKRWRDLWVTNIVG